MQTYWVNDSRRRSSFVPKKGNPGNLFLSGMDLALTKVDENDYKSEDLSLDLEEAKVNVNDSESTAKPSSFKHSFKGMSG